MRSRFDLVKDYYNRGLWTESRVRTAVGKWITEEEAELIVSPIIPSEQYQEPVFHIDPEEDFIPEPEEVEYYIVDEPYVEPDDTDYNQPGEDDPDINYDDGSEDNSDEITD